MTDTDSLTTTTASARETEALGHRIAGVLGAGDVVALTGNLGAGKTQLARGLAAGLGADPRRVASPTFVLMSEYEAPTPVVHIDAYRIESLTDLESIGYCDELISGSVTLIEWADRIAAELPRDHLRIELSHTEGGRRIMVNPVGGYVDRREALARVMKPPATATSCRVCGTPTDPSMATFPFCSQRCRMVDLNRWFKGDYSLSRPMCEDDVTED